MTDLFNLSPLDGRYAPKTNALQKIASEYGLISQRLFVEIQWLLHLLKLPAIQKDFPVIKNSEKFLDLLKNFDITDAEEIKALEKKTNHDVKAVEYFLQEKIKKENPKLIPLIHFGCTSEDVNNLTYALLLRESRNTLVPFMKKIIETLNHFAKTYAAVPMLARTHGQPASPTTIGKEFANYVHRLQRTLSQFEGTALFGKMNGAVGNFNAHHIAYPEIDWPKIAKEFVESLGLHYQSHTTQIEPHDFIAELFHALIRFNNILLDLARDCWGYISLNYFEQQHAKEEVGSSTMPHKINPIDFENAEGNLGLANALADHMANKLTQSRFQRDLSDSTVLRNIGSVFGYALVAYQSLLQGLNKIKINERTLAAELNQHWEILGEAVQTVMRRYGIADAYEQLKHFSRGKILEEKSLHAFIDQSSLPADEKKRLKKLKPQDYVGLASKLSTQSVSDGLRSQLRRS